MSKNIFMKKEISIIGAGRVGTTFAAVIANLNIPEIEIVAVLSRTSESIDRAKGIINVSMNIREVGSSSEDFEVSYGEEKIQIAFNPDFLIDGLHVINEDKIILSIVEPLKPVMIRSEKKDDLLYLLMPIRIS